MLSMQVPGPHEGDQPLTVFWTGKGSLWAPYQRDAARFADEVLARHRLATTGGAPVPRLGFSGTVYCVPALAVRNGGPTTPIITAASGDPQPAAAAAAAEQGDLFGGAQ